MGNKGFLNMFIVVLAATFVFMDFRLLEPSHLTLHHQKTSETKPM